MLLLCQAIAEVLLVNTCDKVMGMVIGRSDPTDTSPTEPPYAYAVPSDTIQAFVQNYLDVPAEGEAIFASCFGHRADGMTNWETFTQSIGYTWTFDLWRTETSTVGGQVYSEAQTHRVVDTHNFIKQGCQGHAPRLAMTCYKLPTETPFSIGIWWSGLPVYLNEHGHIAVEYLVDDGLYKQRHWRSSSHQQESIVPSNQIVGVSHEFINGDTLAFKGRNHKNQIVIEATFDLRNFTQAYEHLQQTCEWGTPMPPLPSVWSSDTGEASWGTYTGTYVRTDLNKTFWNPDWLMLYVRCTNRHQLEVFVVLDSAHIPTKGYINYQFGGQGKTGKAYGAASDTNTALFLRSPDGLIEDLLSDSSGSLTISIYDTSNPTSNPTFHEWEGEGTLDINGSHKDVQDVLDICTYSF